MKRLFVFVGILSFLGLCGSFVSDGMFREFGLDRSGTGYHTATLEALFDTAPVSTTYTTESGHALTLNNMVADPRVQDGTLPGGSTGYAYEFDGSDDCISRADDDTFDFGARDFTLVGVTTVHDATDTGLMSKWANGKRAWVIRTISDQVIFATSSDGSNAATCVKSSVVVPSRPFVFVLSKSGTSANLYVDEQSVATDTVHATLHNSTAPLEIGSYNACGGVLLGNMHYAAILDGTALTQAQAEKEIRQLRGVLDRGGHNYLTTTSASPPLSKAGICGTVTPCFVEQPANTTTAYSRGVFAAATATNYLSRGVLETWSGGIPTSWTKTETPGGAGTASISQDTTNRTDGLSSAKMTLTGTTSVATLKGACITCSDLCGNDPCNCDAYTSMKTKGTASTEAFYVQILEYDANDCTTTLNTMTLRSDHDSGTSWGDAIDTIASGSWNAGTSSLKIAISEIGDGGVTTYVDSVYVGTNDPSIASSYCGSDTSTSTVCSNVVITADNPFEGTVPHYTMVATFETLWVGDDGVTHKLLEIPGTSGSNNRMLLYKSSGNSLTWKIYDSAAGQKQATITANGTTWAANTPHTVYLYKSHDGDIAAWLDGAAMTISGAGTGIQDDNHATIYLGGNNEPHNAWVKDLKFYRRRVEP